MGVATALPVRDVRVEPGATTDVTLLVRNTGQVVDQFSIDVLGDCGPWATAAPAVVNLLPGADAEVIITFAPPRDPHIAAGVSPFGVRVYSREDPEGSSVAEGSVDVGAFSDVVLELVPRQSRGRRRGRHQVAIDNNGNQPTTVEVSAADEEEALDFSLDHRTATIEPGAAAFIRVIAKPEKRFFKGPDRQHAFVVTAAPHAAPPMATRGTMTQRQLLPAWLIPAVAMLAVLAIAAVVLYLTLLKPKIKSTADDAAAKAVKSQGASVSKAASKAQMDAAGANAAANKAAAAASKAVANGGGPGTGKPTTPTPTGGTVNGVAVSNGRATSFSVSTSVVATPGVGTLTPFAAPALKANEALVVTAVIMQNPNGDEGTLQIQRGPTGFLLQEGLANFRDLDHHFDDEPLIFTKAAPLRVSLNCQAAGVGARCQPSILFTGRIVSLKSASTR